MTARRSRTGAWVVTAGAVARRPGLWAPAVRAVSTLARPRWWARPPFLPFPDRAWLRFRLETQYGDADHTPVPADIVTWLGWAGRQRLLLTARPSRRGDR